MRRLRATTAVCAVDRVLAGWPIKRLALLAAASLMSLAAVGIVWAQSGSISRVTIANPGVYELTFGRAIADPNLLGRAHYTVIRKKLIERTTTIPARACISFGFEYVILGPTSDQEIPIRMVTQFPSPGLLDPHTSTVRDRDESVVRRSIGKVHFRSYTLESAWEIVPGIWTLELWHLDRMLAAQSFTITAPCVDCERSKPRQACHERLVAGILRP